MKTSIFLTLFCGINLFATPVFSETGKSNIDTVGDAIRNDGVSQVIKKDKKLKSQPTDEEKTKYYKLMQKNEKTSPSPTPVGKK